MCSVLAHVHQRNSETIYEQPVTKTLFTMKNAKDNAIEVFPKELLGGHQPDKWTKEEEAGLIKLHIADGQNLKVMSLRIRKKIQQRLDTRS